MNVALITHRDCLGHDPGPGHPERPDRLRAVLGALDRPEFGGLRRSDAPEADRALLSLAHGQVYLDRLLAMHPEAGARVALDPDTMLGAGSLRAARLAVGGACAGVDAVVSGKVARAFVAVRPPGHHAEPSRAMGFCLFNSAAIAALHARARWGLRRVAIVDFDVHHGNGTEAIAWADAGFFFASSHQHPCYPGTGAASDTGAHGNVVNATLPPGSDGGAFRRAWSDTILPALARFAPDIVLVSAGFDAHRADPLAALNLDEADFGWVTTEIMRVADAVAGGRLVSVLEGGYDLDALASSAAAHTRALEGR